MGSCTPPMRPFSEGVNTRFECGVGPKHMFGPHATTTLKLLTSRIAEANYLLIA